MTVWGDGRARLVTTVVGACVVAALTGACEPCFGTSDCHGAPRVSITGRVIEHVSGKRVPGTRLAFTWRTGVLLEDDSLIAVSDADGFFHLVGPVPSSGTVRGRLTVTPPSPRAPYTVDPFEAPIRTGSGDGTYLGDVVVDPYYMFVAEVHDLVTGAVVPYADVQVVRTGGVNATPVQFGFTADAGGRISQEIFTDGVGTLDVLATVTGLGYPRPYLIRKHLVPKYLDVPARELDILSIGTGLPTYAYVHRRGFPDYVPGVTLKFRRTGGVAVTPDTFTWAIPSSNVVALNLTPLGDGLLQGEFTVTPPAPFKTEVTTEAILTMDGDSVRFMSFGFGTQVAARIRFLYRATGEQVEPGVHATMVRRSGQALAFAGVLVALDSLGRLSYASATADTGTTVVDFQVHLRAPFDHDTIRGLAVSARYDSVYTDLGTVRVGRWLPWRGSVIDSATGVPISGAQVEFRRVSGVPIAPSPYKSVSAANGQFPIGPVPLRNGEVIGDLVVTFGNTYRDTTIAGIHLTTSTNDTLRLLPAILARKIGP